MLKTEHYIAITVCTVIICVVIIWMSSKKSNASDLSTSSDFTLEDDKNTASNTTMIVVLVISAIILGGAYWYFFMNEKPVVHKVPVVKSPPSTPPPPPPLTPPSPPSPSPSTTSPSKLPSEAYQKNFEVDESLLEETKPNISSNSELTRYVRLEKTVLNSNMSSQLYLNIAEVEVYADGKNVAQGKQAYQISTAPANSFWNPNNTCRKASCAVDGDVNGDWFSTGEKVSTNSITHTYLKPTQNKDKWDLLGKKDTVWWEVDLGSEYKVNVVKVFNRTDMASDRMKHTRVILLDKNRQPLNSFLLEDERSIYEIHV